MEKPKKMCNSNNNCCVYGCKSVRNKDKSLMYHYFPKSGDKVEVTDDFGNVQKCERRKMWETNLRMGKKVSKYMTVCSLHFKSTDYICSGWSRKRLLPTAIPTENLPKRSHDQTKFQDDLTQNRKNARQQRLLNRPFTAATATTTSVAEINNTEDANEANDSNLMSESVAANTLLLLSSQSHAIPAPVKEYRDIGIQVDMQEKQFSDCAVQVNTSDCLTICDFVQNENQLNSLTGIHSFILLNTIVSLVKTIQKDKRVHFLSLYSRVFLVFMKLKLDIPYVVLAVLFKVSSQTCKNIFFNIVPSLALVLKSAIPWPSQNEIKRNIPNCFKEFQNVRIVLDCTEIFVQKHKKLCCRIKCYSHYKGTTTIKFMTGVSPAGLITYVSPPYGGRVSDKKIFERSRLIDKLEMHTDEIMADKGFLIQDICDECGITLVRPPFLRNKKQFTQEESVTTAKIAAARVHIERSNQRIKLFKILNNRLPVNLIPLISDIFIIACGIANLSSPILADDKFLGLGKE